MARYNMIAISDADQRKFGCPHCGNLSLETGMYSYDSSYVRCLECNKRYYIYRDGLKVDHMTTDQDGEAIQLSEHPRKGIPGHGRSNR